MSNVYEIGNTPDVSDRAELKEPWDEEEKTGGFQALLDDDRDLTALLNAWWMLPYEKKGPEAKAENLADTLGLKNILPEEDVWLLIGGEAAPSERLTRYLSRQVPKQICSADTFRAKAAIFRIEREVPTIDAEVLTDSEIYPPKISKKEWKAGQRTGPRYPYFSSSEIIPLSANTEETESIWPNIEDYCRRLAQNLSPLQLSIIPNDKVPTDVKLQAALSANTEIDPWQLCGAAPLYADMTSEDATEALTAFLFPNGANECQYIDLNRQEFLDKALSHFNGIKGIDLERGIKYFPKTPGEVLRICRVRVLISGDELAKRVGYDSRASITDIENNRNFIPLDKIDNFIQALMLTGQNRECFYRLSGHRTPESCIEAMKSATTSGDFARAAREALRMTQEELAELTYYKSHKSISYIENKNYRIPLGKVDLFATALKLEGETLQHFYELQGCAPSPGCLEAINTCTTLGDFVKALREDLVLTQQELGALTGYTQSKIHLIEANSEYISLEKMEKFVETFQLVGEGRQMLYRLSGHRSPEICAKAMKEAKTVGPFVKAARERLHLTQEALIALPTLSYTDTREISRIENDTFDIPFTKVGELIESLQLKGEDIETFCRLAGHRSPKMCTKAMMEADNLGDFAYAARERKHISQKESAERIGYGNLNSIYRIEKNKRPVLLEEIDNFALIYELKGEEQKKFLELAHKRLAQQKKPKPSKAEVLEFPEQDKPKQNQPQTDYPVAPAI
ncbi:MAG: hypothetical protein DHS20C02_08970 [Micavibrio sp.]|nr:MAG: hypothetical protein DHS20C02_08970 [Micavibrio sp.]